MSPSSRKIVYVNNFAGPGMGGGEIQLLRIIRGCVRAGWDVRVLCPPGADLGDRASAEGAHVQRVDMRLHALPALIARVQALAADADIIEGTGYLTGIVVRCAARRGARIINHVAVQPFARTPEGGSALTRAVRRLVHAVTLARVDAFIAVSEAIVLALQATGVPRDRITLVRRGTDLQALEVAAASPLPVMLPPGDGPLVGCVARLEPVKGVQHFVSAAVRLASARTDARFVVAGAGSQAQALAEQIPVGLRDRVVLLGDVRPVEPITAKLVVLVLPSIAEGLPGALFEAGALGVPVVATAVGGIPEVVVDGVTGILVPPQDPAALADAIASLLDDPERARAMGEAGRQRVEQHFTVERMVAETLALYEELLTR